MSKSGNITAGTTTILAMAVLAASCAAQQNGTAPQNPAAPQPQVSEELWQLLADWAKGSANVRKLHGKHVRRAYDHTFAIEKISQGEFWYEAPDKGRIDVDPVKITDRMIEERNQPDAQVQKKDGRPYELKSDIPERWICDGEKVYDINDEQKSARIVHLPPDIRGENIMNSPLPFLFGMPPEKATQRFNMKIIKDYRPKYAVVLLEATPRLRKDADNWSKAKIFLDTNMFLPTGVQLINPAGTKDTRYTFQDMEVNKAGIFERFSNPWDPKLDNSYKVHVIQPGQEQQATATSDSGPVIPNVVGKAHDVATTMLIQAGIPREDISKQNAGPAPRADLTYLVREQQPKAGSPIRTGDKIVLRIFDKPNPAGGGNAGGSRQPAGNVARRP
ncbi:MAG: hypothetical protein RIK87_30470 [Fuerstiella sp.]